MLPPAAIALSWLVAGAVASVVLLVKCARIVNRAAGVPAVVAAAPSSGVAKRVAHLEGRSEEELRRVARHEAAHAVVALRHGARDVRADLQHGVSADGTPFRGRVTCSGLDAGRPAAWVRMVVAHAGNIVDQEVGGFFDERSMDDLRLALTAAAGVLSTGQRPPGYEGELSTDALMAGARAQARVVLEQHRDLVEAVTEALLDPANDARLDHEQLTQILHVTTAREAPCL